MMTAINIIVSILELLLFFLYISVLEPRRFFQSRLARAAAFPVLIYPWYLIHLESENMGELKLFLLIFIILFVLFRLDLPHTLFIASSFACLIQTCGIMGFFMLRFLVDLQPVSSSYFFLILLELILLLIKALTVWLHRHYLPDLTRLKLKKSAVLLSLMPLVMMAVAATLYLYAFDASNSQSQRLFFAGLILAIAIFIYFSIFSNTRRVVFEQRDAENRKIQEALKQQLTLTESFRERENTVRRMKHDMKNHLLALDSLTSAEQMHEYIHALLGQMNQVPALEHTGCTMADAVINRKLPDLQALGAELKIVADLRGFAVNDADCCSIFANAFDNAAEALTGCPDGQRWFSVKAYRQSGFLVLKFTNPCSLKPIRNREDFVSRKEGDHGLGIKSIRYSASHYDGRVEADWADGLFTLTILFPEQKVLKEEI